MEKTFLFTNTILGRAFATVIEMILPSDKAVKVDEKVAEYFKAGVQVVWHIYPETEAVYVFTSRRNVGVCV